MPVRVQKVLVHHKDDLVRGWWIRVVECLMGMIREIWWFDRFSNFWSTSLYWSPRRGFLVLVLVIVNWTHYELTPITASADTFIDSQSICLILCFFVWLYCLFAFWAQSNEIIGGTNACAKLKQQRWQKEVTDSTRKRQRQLKKSIGMNQILSNDKIKKHYGRGR